MIILRKDKISRKASLLVIRNIWDNFRGRINSRVSISSKRYGILGDNFLGKINSHAKYFNWDTKYLWDNFRGRINSRASISFKDTKYL